MSIGSRMMRVIVTASILFIAIAAASLAIRPAIASGGSTTVTAGPFTLVICTVAAPGDCQQYRNKGTGGAIEGDAYYGTGVHGTSGSSSSVAVLGASNHGIGVKGTSSTSIAVYGSSPASYGVYGVSSTNDGVYGATSSASGVFGLSSTGIAVQGQGGSGIGVLSDSYGTTSLFADNLASGFAIEALGGGNGAPSIFAQPNRGGPAGYFDGTNGGTFGIEAFSNTSGTVAFYGTNSNGNGADVAGSYIGVIGRAPASGGFPLVLTDSSGHNLFYVDGGGNVFYHGTLNSFAFTPRGAIARGYGSVSTSPTVEDNGTARLIDGIAMVSLDPTFAQTIDSREAYHVMLTPDGDTRGLFVASKSPTGFVVREVQGGRSSISFDYHIYAPALGRADERMTLVGRSAGMPNAPIVAPRRFKATAIPTTK